MILVLYFLQDLSRLGEEGETPASDEIWLSVGGGGEDDKFLTSDSETYSVATDKLSTAATLAGHVTDGAGGISPSAMSENDLVRFFKFSIVNLFEYSETIENGLVKTLILLN